MSSHEDGSTPFAPCCLGMNCRIADVVNGEFPLAATSRRCVVCIGVLHPLCGEINSQSSLLTCFSCFEAYGQTFESQELAALLVIGLTGMSGSPLHPFPPSQEGVILVQETEQ